MFSVGQVYNSSSSTWSETETVEADDYMCCIVTFLGDDTGPNRWRITVGIPAFHPAPQPVLVIKGHRQHQTDLRHKDCSRRSISTTITCIDRIHVDNKHRGLCMLWPHQYHESLICASTKSEMMIVLAIMNRSKSQVTTSKIVIAVAIHAMALLSSSRPMYIVPSVKPTFGKMNATQF